MKTSLTTQERWRRGILAGKYGMHFWQERLRNLIFFKEFLPKIKNIDTQQQTNIFIFLEYILKLAPLLTQSKCIIKL